MLVQRIGILRFEAHGIRRAEFKTAAVLVNMAAFVTQTEDLLVRCSSGEMHGSITQLAGKVLSEAIAVLIQDPFLIRRGDPEIQQFDLKAQTIQFKRNNTVFFTQIR